MPRGPHGMTPGPVDPMLLTDFHSAFDLETYRFFNRDGGPWLDALMRLLSTRLFGVAFGLLLCAVLCVALRRGARQARPEA